jgi:hypothetical protein
MARDQNTFAKRQRELQKKQKAADKRAKRQGKKEHTNETNGPSAEQSSAVE